MDPYAAQTYPQNQPQNQDQYLYNQQYDQSQHYAYYTQVPQHQYPNPNPNPVPNQEHVPIHPPGVPIQSDPNQISAYQHVYGQTHFQSDPNSYYPQAQQQPQQLSYSDPATVQQQQWQQQGQTGGHGFTSLYPPSEQGQYSGAGRGGGGRGVRGGGTSFRGRVRGRGRGGKPIVRQPKPQFLAWCELCRVDCNTHETLASHKNGKKHKKNVKIQEELQKLAAKNQQTQVAEKPPENPSLISGSKVEGQAAVAEEHGGSLKRKAGDGDRKSAEASKKPKEIIPFICELCDVKCESAPTFDSHLKGKKHIFNLQRFQEQQATLGQAALLALYPALEALYPALLQAISQNASAFTPGANGGLDQQVLQWLQAYLPQAGPSGLPPGPAPAIGAAQEAPLEVAQNQVTSVTEVKEPESKNEDQVEPESKTEDQVGSESKIEQVNSIAAE